MTGFKDIADGARRELEEPQRRKDQEALALQNARTLSLDRATQEKQRLESIGDKLQRIPKARELLAQVNPHGLLTSIRNDVWGVGTVENSSGSFVVDIKDSGDPSDPNPFKAESGFYWPKSTLFAAEVGMKWGTATVGGGTSEFKGRTFTHPAVVTGYVYDGVAACEFNLAAKCINNDLILAISRKNYVFQNKSPKTYTWLDYAQLNYSPDYSVILSDLSLLYPLFKKRGVEIDGNTMSINTSVNHFQETVLDILQKIVYQDVKAKQLPNDFFAKVRAFNRTKEIAHSGPPIFGSY